MGSLQRERETRTILALLREQMDGVDGIRTTTRRRTLKERLGLTGMGCCGATWNFRPTTIDASDTEEEDHHHQQEDQPAPIEHVINRVQFPTDSTPDPVCLGMPLTPGGMNLATALAAERHYRAAEGTNNVVALAPNNNDSSSNVGQTETAPGTPMKVSLMRLLAETDGCDGEEKAGGGEVGNDSMCCVCMGRKKGAAFIPCGHTFCRLCSRELWLNRGSCPLCNRSIHEILDIF